MIEVVKSIYYGLLFYDVTFQWIVDFIYEGYKQKDLLNYLQYFIIFAVSVILGFVIVAVLSYYIKKYKLNIMFREYMYETYSLNDTIAAQLGKVFFSYINMIAYGIVFYIIIIALSENAVVLFLEKTFLLYSKIIEINIFIIGLFLGITFNIIQKLFNIKINNFFNYAACLLGCWIAYSTEPKGRIVIEFSLNCVLVIFLLNVAYAIFYLLKKYFVKFQ